MDRRALRCGARSTVGTLEGLESDEPSTMPGAGEAVPARLFVLRRRGA